MAVVEIFIEFLEFLKYSLHMRGRGYQVCDPKVVRAFSLTEARTWNSHDACLVHHLHAVDEVWLLSLVLGLLNELLREVYLRKPVHSALDFCACDLLHFVESARKKFSAFLHAAKDNVSLFVVNFEALCRFATHLGRVDHQVYSELSRRVRTQLDRL